MALAKETTWLRALAGLTALYHLLVASRALTWLGIFVPQAQHRATSLLLALLLLYLTVDARGETKQQARPRFWELLLLAGGLVGAGFVALFYNSRVLEYAGYGFLDPPGIALALMLALALLEASRRVTGWAFPALIVVLLLVVRFQNLLPGLLNGRGYPLDRLGYAFYVGTAGIFGLPLGVAATVLITYVIFGRLLQEAGAGEWFTRLALAVAGWIRGGPAKTAVLASALFGTISGSPSANAASIGIFTIPLMKRFGYPAAVAGAVEAVASTGGQLMPPVMGAIAFIMAEWLGISYGQVALAAALPAVLYYVIVFVSVHLQALRDGLQAVPRRELPDFKKTLVEGWFYVLPLGVLVYFLLARGYAPELAAFYSLPVLVATSFLSKEKSRWLTPPRIWEALVSSVHAWLPIAMVTGSVGMLVGGLELSGLGVKLSSFILDVAGDNLTLALVLVGLASFVLGTALDSIPCYITLATLTAPALIEMGLPPIVAHLYVIYWGLASFITPPECHAVYVACGISGSKLWETGWEAMKLGMGAYIVPLAFAFSPALLLMGGPGEILFAAATALVGAILLSAAVQGYALGPLTVPQRLLMGVGGCLLVGPGVVNAVVGLSLGAAALIWQRLQTQPALRGAPARALDSDATRR